MSGAERGYGRHHHRGGAAGHAGPRGVVPAGGHARPAEEFEAWHVRDAEQFRFGPDDELTGERPDEFRRLAGELEAATDEFGEVAVVGDGMRRGRACTTSPRVDVGSDRVDVLRVQRRAEGCLGCVVADAETREAVGATYHLGAAATTPTTVQSNIPPPPDPPRPIQPRRTRLTSTPASRVSCTPRRILTAGEVSPTRETA